MTITLSEYQSIGSIWGGILALEPFPFADTTPAAQLDAMLGLDYGDRTMFSKMVALPIATVSANIVALYKDSWLKLIEIQAMDLDVTSGATRKQTETINKTEVRNSSTDNVNKVSAFNSDDLINNDGNNSTGLDDLAGDTTRVLTDAQISLANAFNNLSLLDKSNILRTVNKDVASYLTLDVY